MTLIQQNVEGTEVSSDSANFFICYCKGKAFIFLNT